MSASTDQREGEHLVRAFRRLPVKITAAQWDGTADGAARIVRWVLDSGGAAHYATTNGEDGRVVVSTLEGDMPALPGWWIIRGVEGEFYPCKDTVFAALHEPVNGEAKAAVPSVGMTVHYVSFGTPGGEYPSVCRAAIVTEVGAWVTVHEQITEKAANSEGYAIRHQQQWYLEEAVGLCVLNPTGQFFNPVVRYSPGDPGLDAGGARCAGGDRVYPGGTWHWPERD